MAIRYRTGKLVTYHLYSIWRQATTKPLHAAVLRRVYKAVPSPKAHVCGCLPWWLCWLLPEASSRLHSNFKTPCPERNQKFVGVEGWAVYVCHAERSSLAVCCWWHEWADRVLSVSILQSTSHLRNIFPAKLPKTTYRVPIQISQLDICQLTCRKNDQTTPKTSTGLD